MKSKKSPEKTVTQKMLYAVRSELKHEMTSNKLELKGDIKLSELMLGGKINALDSKINSFEPRFSSIDAKFSSIDARFSSIDARFNLVDARFNDIDLKFKGVDARFDSMDSKFEKVLSALEHIRVDIEEQKRDNKIVIDGYASLHHRVSRLEGKEA